MTGNARPSSFESEVTPASRMPQGTIRSNQVLSGFAVQREAVHGDALGDAHPDRADLAVLAALAGVGRCVLRPVEARVELLVVEPRIEVERETAEAAGRSSTGSPSTHAPLRPSIRVVSRPKSAQARIMASSSRRTCSITSTGRGSFRMG